MFDYLSWLGVDGHTISPGYDYDSAKEDMRKRLNLQPENFFLTRAMTQGEVQEYPRVGRTLHVLRNADLPRFLGWEARVDLLCLGHPDTVISAAGRPLATSMTDGHYSSYRELLEKTEWEKYGVVDGVARDKRCEKLHGALRLRAQRHTGSLRKTRRHLAATSLLTLLPGLGPRA